MAKISYNKFEKPTYPEDKVVEFQGQQIEVRQYLPMSEKLAFATRVIERSYDPAIAYINPIGYDIQFAVQIINTYTNIELMIDEEGVDLGVLYDEIVASGLYKQIISAIPAQELETLRQYTDDIIEHFYKYKQSAQAVIEMLTTDYDNLNFDIESMQKKLVDIDQNMGLVKEVVNKLN